MKIYNVIQESNVDGEIFINVTPCVSEELAKKILKENKETILNESYHFGKDKNSDDDYEYFDIEDTETAFYINDSCDNYYEYIKIEEKELVA